MNRYFVDAITGDDSQDGTSPDRAWQHIDRASEIEYTPGTVVSLEAGQVHAGTVLIRGAGASDQPIVITSHGGNGDTATIQEQDNDNTHGVAIRLLADHVRVEHLTITGARYAAIESYQTHHHITLADMRLLHNAAGYRCKSSDIEITRCTFTNTLMADDSGDSNDNGAFSVSIEPIADHPVSNIQIHDNSFIGNKAKSKTFRRDGEFGLFGSINNLRIFNNYFAGNKTVMEWGGRGTQDVISDVSFFGNTMLNNYGRWLFVNDPAGGFGVTLNKIHFYRNRFVDAFNSNTPLWFAGTPEAWQTMHLATEFRMTANIVYSLSKIANRQMLTAANLFYRAGGQTDIGFPPDVTDAVTDPEFYDALTGDLRRPLNAALPGAGVGRPRSILADSGKMQTVSNHAQLLDMYGLDIGTICYVINEDRHYYRTRRGWMPTGM